MKSSRLSLVGLACAMYGASPWVHAQNGINDTLTGTSSSYGWIPLGGACLTAGNGTGSIPACHQLDYYAKPTDGSPPSRLVGGVTGTFPDPVGEGALRLTNGDTRLVGADKTFGQPGTNSNKKSGAVVGAKGFPTNSGVQITFKTVTYGGNGYDKATKQGNSTGQGADGMSFFLADADKAPSIGAIGGSLGYACNGQTVNGDGVLGGYIGIGIDEYGNFNDKSVTTNSGAPSPGPAITLRAAGSIAYSALSETYPEYYPASIPGDPDTLPNLRNNAVKTTCATGVLQKYDSVTKQFIAVPQKPTDPPLPNYRWVSSSSLPAGFQIASQQGLAQPLRKNAIPITYSVKITQDGILDFSYSVKDGIEIPVILGKKITDESGPLPKNFRFGFAASTGNGSNIHEITCFKAEPVNKSESSAGSNAGQTTQIQAGTQLYLAFYHPTNSWGELRAQNLVFDAANKAVSISSIANWNASCTLTGGSCPATGVDTTAQAPSSRTMLSWNPSSGAPVPFRWSFLGAAQQVALGSVERLDYLRGGRSKEVKLNSGVFRKRDSVLGDIVSSGPTWVGPPNLPYSNPWTDALNSSAAAPEKGGQTYEQFKASAALRQNVVYVGANDGFLHGLRAGAFDASNNFAPGTATPNDGAEVLAYMPSSVLNTIHSSSTPSLDFGNTSYAHNLFVDATPGMGDLYYNKAWHTWLVSGIGGGANPTGPIADKTSAAQGTLFALDVTDPANFSESNASAIVKGEWTSATLTCNVANCGANLGSIYGTPIIRRLHDGNWAALFGNGLNSANGRAGLFVMHVNAATGAVTFRFLDTGSGPTQDPAGGSAKNGIVQVASADLDADHITDYVYAGDVFGKLWRFDLTDANPGNWAASAAPLFATPNGEPISTSVTVSGVPGIGSNGETGVLLAFGTGQQWPQTLTSGATTAPGNHALYGIWDTNLGAWNAKAIPAAQYAFLSPVVTVTASDLQSQEVVDDVDGKRTLSTNRVCWRGSTTCTGKSNDKLGWTLPLPAKNEQVVYNPITAYDKLIVNTLIPAESANKLSCEAPKPTGYTMAPLLATGGADSTSFFADKSGNFVNLNGRPISGLAVGFVGAPFVATASDGTAHLVGQTGLGTPNVAKINPSGPGKGKRLTWIKRR